MAKEIPEVHRQIIQLANEAGHSPTEAQCRRITHAAIAEYAARFKTDLAIFNEQVYRECLGVVIPRVMAGQYRVTRAK